jgi:cholesterol transport system auxiliary component
VKIARLLAATAAVSLSLGLGGCVTLFPKAKAVQLYSFGGNIGRPAATPAVEQTSVVGTLRMSVDFARAADRDQILTATGDAEAYIADARWIAPASVLFEEAADRAFETTSPPIRLLRRADAGIATLTLRVDVQTFETDYPANGRGDPTVVVRVRTLLNRAGDHGAPLEGHFESRKPVDENRVGHIVSAYDAATADVLKQVVDWTTEHAG